MALNHRQQEHSSRGTYKYNVPHYSKNAKGGVALRNQTCCVRVVACCPKKQKGGTVFVCTNTLPRMQKERVALQK